MFFDVFKWMEETPFYSCFGENVLKQLYWGIVDIQKNPKKPQKTKPCMFNVYNLMSLNICICLWNHSQGDNISITSKSYHVRTLNFVECLFCAYQKKKKNHWQRAINFMDQDDSICKVGWEAQLLCAFCCLRKSKIS